MADYWKQFTFSYHLCLDLPSGRSPSGFLPKTWYVFPYSIHHILLHFITITRHDTRATDHVTLSDSSYFLPLTPTYSTSLYEIINFILIHYLLYWYEQYKLIWIFTNVNNFWTVPGKWDTLTFNYVALCKSEAFLPGRKQYRTSCRGAGTVPLALDIGSICYFSLNIIRVIKSRRMRRAGHITRMEERRGIYRILVRKTEGKRPLGRSRRIWNYSPLRWIFRKWDGGYGLDWSGSG
jgi:hypothetical protein